MMNDRDAPEMPLADVRALLDRIAQGPPRGPEYEVMPTVAEGMQLLRSRPGVWSVLTEGGVLTRDGTLTLPRWSA